MTKEEAIKYLQQLYPNGGHCRLDEQRIEAIGMAVKALQEEHVSEELEEASKEWLRPQLDKSYAAYGETKQMELTHFDGYAMLDAIEFGAKWGKNQAMAEIQAQSMALAHGCPEESKSEDLERAAEQDVCEVVNCCSATGIPNDHIPSWVQDAMINEFIHGAKWQKEQIMKDAVDGTMGFVSIHLKKPNFGEKFKEGDKVKILLIKGG